MVRTLGKSGLLFAFVLAFGFAAHATSTATITVSGAEKAGDASIITVTFNGFVETVSYGQFSTSASIASAFGAMFSRDYVQNGLSAQVVCGGSSSVITFTLQGSASFGTLTTSGSTNSFQLTSSGFASDSAQYADTGTVTLSVNGSAIANADYGPESTSTTVAQDLANAASSSLVSVTAFDNSLRLEAINPGTGTIPYSVTSRSTNPAFTSPSFSGSPSSGNVGGGTGSGTDTAATVYSFTGTYDHVSNLTGYADSVMGSWTFTPDTLNRLVTAHNTATTSTSTQFASDWGCWIYDAFGNRLSQSMSTTACTSSPPFTSWAQYNGTVNGTNNNQMSQTNQNGLQAGGYDAAGDVTDDGVNQYLYDAEGRICAVSSTPVPGITTMTGYLYDADGTRIAKGTISAFSCNLATNGFTTTTDYVLGPSGEQVSEMAVSGSTLTWSHTNVSAGGMLLATYDNTGKGLHFYLDDPLGTRRVQTDYLGVLEQTCASLPFGDDLTCSGSATTPTEHHFTGKERDSESGNDYFEARYYASSMGRFMSPDWSAKVEPVPYSKLDDPQSLNLYAYVLNNPMTGYDADGHDDSAPGGDAYNSTAGQAQLAFEEGGDPAAAAMAWGASTGTPKTQNGQQAQQQNSSSGPGFWGRLGQRLNNFFHNNGLVTNAELDQVHGAFTSVYIVPGSVHEIEPNSYVTLGLDAAGIGATLTGHAYAAGGIAAGSSIYNPDPMNLGLNGMSLVPGALGEAAMPLTVVNDAGGLAGGVITNNVMAPMLMSIPGDTMNDGYGHTVPTPEATCVASGMC